MIKINHCIIQEGLCSLIDLNTDLSDHDKLTEEAYDAEEEEEELSFARPAHD